VVPTEGRPVRVDGYTFGLVPRMEHPPPHRGEMQPDGDELLYFVAGRVTVVLDDGDQDRVGVETRHEVGPGEAFLVPRGVWHRIEVIEPAHLAWTGLWTSTGLNSDTDEASTWRREPAFKDEERRVTRTRLQDTPSVVEGRPKSPVPDRREQLDYRTIQAATTKIVSPAAIRSTPRSISSRCAWSLSPGQEHGHEPTQ